MHEGETRLGVPSLIRSTQGWGIRLTPHGWQFNVAGLDAAEIRMDDGRTYRIGTDEPDALRSAIESALAPPQAGRTS